VTTTASTGSRSAGPPAQNLTVPQRTERVEAQDLEIKILGPCRHESPLTARLGVDVMQRVGAAERVLLDDRLSTRNGHPHARIPTFEVAGPRDRIFFDPAALRCGIVTCGGLCPGINNVIRGLVLELTHSYGVKEIFGFRYGFEGMVARHGHEPVRLGPAWVSEIHEKGGTVLGTSRGSQDPVEMVDTLAALGIGALFVVGGDGTLPGATKIVAEIERRGLLISVIGIPKTIDNDIHFIDRSFGFESAFSAAVEVIRSARVEATGARDGIGLVKLMGRESGFIAADATLVNGQVNYCLVPEVPLDPEKLLRSLDERLDQRRSLVAHDVRTQDHPGVAFDDDLGESGGVLHRPSVGDVGVVLHLDLDVVTGCAGLVFG
jgi:6-phosphofructokinase 1